LKYKFLISALLIALTISSVNAQSFRKYAGEFLYLGAGSRVLAMGGAGTAATNDVTAGYWNPAGLREAAGLQLEFMHSKQFISSIQQNYLAVSRPLDERQTVGLSFIYLTVNGIKDSRQAYNAADNHVDYSKIRLFNTGDYIFLFSYAAEYNEKINYGVNIKTIYRDFHSASGWGIGFDAGLKYLWTERLSLGLMLRDITSTMLVWSTGEKELITPSVRAGISYKFPIPSLHVIVEPTTDFNFLLENRRYASQMHLGALSLDVFGGLEVRYGKYLALRGGMDDLQRFTTGIGFSIPKITFDYSFTAYQSELGNIHRISFHLQFGS